MPRRDDLAAQLGGAGSGRFSPDYREAEINTGTEEVLARSATAEADVTKAPEKAKASQEEAYYTTGMIPFVCETCCEFGPDNYCRIVSGPGEDGRVKPQDTCRWWTPRARPN